MEEQTKLDDSGERISYGDGMAIREPSTGKGRYDLVSPFAMRRLAQHYENGARKYTFDQEIVEEVLLSEVEKELEQNLSAVSAVSIEFIVKECAEAAMKNLCEQEIQNMSKDKGKIQQSGMKSIQNGCETQHCEEEKTQNVESEIKEQNEEMRSENEDLQKKHIYVFIKNKIIAVQYAEDLLRMSGRFISIMTITQEEQEDCYVVDAITESECLKSLLLLCKKLLPTFSIRQQTNSSMKTSYLRRINGGRNWEKGMPFSRYIDSAKRHLDKYIMGMTDEDHLAAAAWNIFAIMHHQELGQTELDDMPHYDCKYEHE